MELISHEIKLTGANAGSYTSELSFNGTTAELTITAKSVLVLDVCNLVFKHDFSNDSRIFVNGYQSWTNSRERRVHERARDLSHVPDAIVKHFALDAMGDYRFVEYNTHAGHYHGFTYATLRDGAKSAEDDELVLIGSLDDSDGFTLIDIDAGAGTVKLSKECPNRTIEPGERLTLCRCAIIAGTCDAVFDRYFELMESSARRAQPLCGYTSWYRHYGTIDEKKLVDDLASVSISLDRIDTSGLTRVFQIDDGWCKIGDWLHIDSEKFPNGLKPIAYAASAYGFTPGLWMAPFVCEKDSHLAHEHPDWLLHDNAGNPVTTGSHWTGGLALDTRNPELRDYVRSCIRTAAKDWGFKLLKLDFLYTACMLPHDGLNRGQLMADAMDLIREAAGQDCMILACGVPLASAFGKVEYCRIGCDVGPDWDDKLYMRALHSERVSTKHNIENTVARAPLNGRAFLNDPDVCFLNDDVRLTKAQRKMQLDAAANHAGMLLTSDDMGKWTDEMLERYESALHSIRERCSS